ERHIAQLDTAVQPLQPRRNCRLRNAGHVIENIENPFSASGGFLRDGHDAAHRIEPRIETADIGQECRQHPYRDLFVGDLPNTEHPYDEQADLRQQRDGRREQGPQTIDAIVDLEVPIIRLPETLYLALFLGKGLDHAYTGNRIGQYVGDLRPDAIDFLEAMAQPVAYRMDHPDNER